MTVEGRAARTIDVAGHVHSVLAKHGLPCAVIGAMALDELRSEGFEVEVRAPDADDPLGGVIDVKGPDFDCVQVVNFLNPYSWGAGALANEALRDSLPDLIEGSDLRVVDLPHLVAFKLYAGGRRSEADVLELLERNRPVDLARLRDVCARHRLGPALEKLLAELDGGEP